MNSPVKNKWQEISKLIKSYDSFALTTHINPDGDAIGSEIALKSFLEDIDKNAVIVNSSVTPDNLGFLDPSAEIKVYSRETDRQILDDVDAVFILDVNNWEHLGAFGKTIRKSSKPRLCIDHHVPDDEDDSFAEVIVSDTSYAATGMLVYELIQSMNGTISWAIAEAVYAAIITDTGTFRFSNTDANVFRLAAEMCDRGVDPQQLYRRVFASKTWGTGKLLGPVLNTVESTADGRLAWIAATQEMFADASASYDDSDGFIDLVRAIKGVELVLFFKEIPDGKIKVSLRSNGKVDAHSIARSFGGGGHRMASGMKVDGPMKEAIARVVDVCLQIDGIKDPPN
ncbi:MAG: bifunctional oligoribonuclease/PAP phosphatase NrnA [Candidatus Krumholzibacteria bacterium]|nr:bifunctional oligoribonuclease/PAP phosphatase NrnA [Candidatus Krumholzibacteria bacterium]